MKRLLIPLCILLLLVSPGYSQTTSYCSTFNNGTGISEWDPNNTITYSVSANELTIVFTNTVLWGGSNEVKIDFPSLLDLSGASTNNIVAFDAKASGSIDVTGGGCSAGTNYIPLGFCFYDNNDNYTNGFQQEGASIYAATYNSYTADISNWGTAVNTSIKGISIKPADPGNNCTSGTSVVNGTIIIRNLKINGGTCAAISTPTSFCGDFASTSGLSEYDPNNRISYSVASNELTIGFANAVIYTQNEIKLDFPGGLDLSSASIAELVTFDVKVSTAIAVTGGGCTAGTNFVPLAFAFYDNSGDTYSTGFSTTTGIFDETQYVHFEVDATLAGTNFDKADIKGIAIQAGDPGNSCTSGTSVVNGEIKIKNFGINSSTCGTATSTARSQIAVSSKLYPNPVSDIARVELNLKSTSAVRVTLSDVMGKEVMTIADGSFSELSKEFSVLNLNKGIYTVNYFINGEAAKAEMLMVK